ncbi:MAG TPA: hypothetical protein VEP66_22270 [Myxococcales bacterium]|nr:hypothetical protein [Myxococcales bacterium]
MDWLALKLASWLIHALVVMVSVAAVSPGNPGNTLPRALLVTLLVAVVVTPFAWFWFLIIPGIIALVAWFLIYNFAYGIRFGQSFAAALVQAVLGVFVDFLLPPHMYLHGQR